MTISAETTRKGAPIVRDAKGERYLFAPGTPQPDDLTEGGIVRVKIKAPASGPNVGQVVLLTEERDQQ